VKVTIGIPVFNYEKWVSTLQSRSGANFVRQEIIFVDYGSTDRWADICKSFGSQVGSWNSRNEGYREIPRQSTKQSPSLQPFVWEDFPGGVRYLYKQAICHHPQGQSIQHWRWSNPG
jgi:glycosyltransferase involved in cell wall biosynthesis